MKLLRDVVKSRSSFVERYSVDLDDGEPEHYGGEDYPQHVGQTDCCGWLYSEVAYLTDRIRHMSYCHNFNPNGINEY